MRVSAKGQVTIPQNIREAAGLLPGTDVSFDMGGDGIVRLRRATGPNGSDTLRAAIESLRGSAGSGLSTDEIIALTRAEDG